MISKGYLTNITTILLLVCIGFLSSCNKEEVAISKNYPVEVNVTETTDTKISTNGTKLYWQEGDKLSLFAASAGNSSTGSATLELNSIDAGSATGKFRGEISLSAEPNMCYFTHPSSCTPSYADSKVSAVFDYSSQDGTHKPFLWGKAAYPTNGILNCTLSHVGGMVALSNIPSGVTSITIKGNSAEQLSPITINMADGSATIGSNTEFTFNISGTSAYICMPPVNFSKGFSIIYNSSSGSMYKSYSSDGGAESGYNFTAGKYVIIDAGENFTPISVTSTASYSHTTSAGFLTGTQVTATPNLQGVPAKIKTSWRAELVHWDNSTIVRSIPANNNFSATSINMDVTDGWEYLPAGTYKYKFYYTLNQGTENVVTTDLSIVKATAPVNITLSSKIEHTYVNSTLTGSKATITATNNSNLPITSWSAILKNSSDNTTVREILDKTSFGTVDFFGNEYISRQKTYTPVGTCVVKGDVLNCATASQINAPDPDITLSVVGYTTYDYYMNRNLDEANNLDNRLKIEGITTTGYDSSLSEYCTSTTIKCDGIVITEPEIGGLTIGTHTLQAQVVLDGLTFTSEVVTKHITGLPFRANPPTSSDGWELGDYASIQDNGLRLGLPVGKWQTGKSTATSPTFYCPSDISIKLDIKISKVTTAWADNTLTIAIGSTNVISTEQEECENKSLSGTGTLSSSNNKLKLTNSATVVGRHFTIHDFFLQYDN